MQSFVTSKNAQWRRLIWSTLYTKSKAIGLGSLGLRFSLTVDEIIKINTNNYAPGKAKYLSSMRKRKVRFTFPVHEATEGGVAGKTLTWLKK